MGRLRCRWPGGRALVAFLLASAVLSPVLAVLPTSPASAQPPTVPVITSPTANASEATPSVEVTGTADAGADVGVLDGGTLVGGTTADGSGNWSTYLTLLDGPHTLTAVAVDPGDGTESTPPPESAPSSAVSISIAGNQLITNGDFGDSGQGQFPSSIDGWTAASALYPGNITDPTANCEGIPYETPNQGYGGFNLMPTPPDGSPQWIELAPGCVSGIEQNVPTVPGGQYVLSFEFAARQQTNPDENTMSVDWNGSYLAGSDAAGSGLQGVVDTWTTYQYAVTATGTSTPVEFDDTNPNPADTVGDELVSVSVQPASALYPNTSWTTAQTVAANTPINEPIDFTGESLWYALPVDPGQQLSVSLSNLPADYEIGLYSDIQQAYDAQTAAGSTPDLADLGAETPGAAFSNSAFSNSAFSNSAFSNSAFSNSAFSNSAFSNSAFSNSAFSNSAFSNSAFSNSAFSNSAFSAGYSSAEFDSLQAISTTVGAVDKSVTANTWNNTGNYYIRITGNNGADAPFQPFTLTVNTSAGLCVDGSGNPIALQNFSGDGTISGAGQSPQTVIVDDSQTMANVGSGYTGPTPLSPALQELAADTDGVVVDVSQSPQVAALAAQAAEYPQCSYAPDLEAAAIQNIINSFREPNPNNVPSLNNLKYVVIVGDDDVIPFFRYPDEAGLAPESNYQPPLASTSAADAALQTPDYLSDDQYGAANVLTIEGSPVPLPTAAVGRLVETPADIYSTIESYVNGAQTIQAKSSLVTGYSFMQPPASRDRDRLVDRNRGRYRCQYDPDHAGHRIAQRPLDGPGPLQRSGGFEPLWRRLPGWPLQRQQPAGG